MLFCSTRVHPLIQFGEECQALQQGGHKLRLCHVELIEHEHAVLIDERNTRNLMTSEIQELICPPPPFWAAPNGWDYWDWPYAYIE